MFNQRTSMPTFEQDNGSAEWRAQTIWQILTKMKLTSRYNSDRKRISSYIPLPDSSANSTVHDYSKKSLFGVNLWKETTPITKRAPIFGKTPRESFKSSALSRPFSVSEIGFGPLRGDAHLKSVRCRRVYSPIILRYTTNSKL